MKEQSLNIQHRAILAVCGSLKICIPLTSSYLFLGNVFWEKTIRQMYKDIPCIIVANNYNIFKSQQQGTGWISYHLPIQWDPVYLFTNAVECTLIDI